VDKVGLRQVRHISQHFKPWTQLKTCLRQRRNLPAEDEPIILIVK
jgi:hypothetical protein